MPPLTEDDLRRFAEQGRHEMAARAALQATAEQDPPVARRDAALQRDTGFSYPIFDPGGRALAEIRAHQNEAGSAIARAPALAPVLSDPRRFSLVADHLSTAADIAAAINRHTVAQTPQPTWAQVQYRYGPRNQPLVALAYGLNSALAWADEALAGVGQAFAESPVARALPGIAPGEIGARLTRTPSPMDIAASTMRDLGDYYQRTRLRSTIDYGNRYGNDIARGVESVPAQAIALLAAARGQPEASVAILGTLQGGSSYREARQAGMSPGGALTYGTTQGGLEALGEILPVFGFAKDAARGTGFWRTMGHQLVEENVGEQITQHLQDFETWAAIDANHGKTFSDYLAERPSVALDTFIQVSAAAGLQTGAGHGANVLVTRYAENRRAEADGANLDRVMDAASQSPLRRESPGDFQDILAEQLQDRHGENIYVPAANVRALFQSPGDMADDPFWRSYAAQINEAEALGGDVVIPLAVAATHLAGNPQWAALKDHVRSSPGGMSRAEAAEWDTAFTDAIRKTGEEFNALAEQDRASMEPGQKVFEAMRDKLMLAGFRTDVANNLATQFAQRQAVRAQRLGRELTGSEADPVEVRQVLPENLAKAILPAETPDAGLRAVIAEMRRKRAPRSDRTRLGPSLLEWIKAQGGIEDRGGDIAAMGAAKIKGFSKKGQRKLIRPHEDVGQGSMLGAGGFHENSPDDLALRAWEAGYFSEHPDRPTVNHLLDAIAEGLSGRDRYSSEYDRTGEVDQLRTAAQELHALLDQQGLDPEKATPAEIAKAVSQYQAVRAVGRGYDQTLFEEPTQPERSMTRDQRAELEARQLQSKARRGGQESVKDQVGGLFSSERDQSSLFQSYGDGPRGRITFTADGRSIIDLFQARDLSTFLHESGHLYLEELKADSADALSLDTPDGRQLFADFEAIKAWFKREGHEIGADGTIPTEAHELWARGFERYAMEGKAPSSALRRAFEAFRSWLLNIYKTTDSLKAPITPEIRDVMDRLMATDEEIAAAAEEQNIKALFTSAEQAGMTEQEFLAYKESAGEARGEAHTELLKRVMANVRASRTKEWREQEANVRGEVSGEVDSQPVFKALRLLRTGRLSEIDEDRNVKLDKKWLIDTYGPEALDAMPRSIPPIYSETNTVHADEIAEETGFKSGDEMVRTLMGHEQARQELKAKGDKRSPRQVQIDEETAARMADRHGDPLRDGSIEEEARALIHNDKQGEVIAAEIRALARKTKRRATPYEIARKWAAEKIAGGRAAEVISGAALQQYERAARKAAGEAEAAILRGDADETYRQKQRQMLNNALISEGKKAKDRVDIAVRRLGKLARRKTMASVDQAYLEQAHGLLEQVDLRPRSQVSIDSQESFEAWAQAREAEGHDIVVPASFAATLGTTHWSRLSVEQLLGLDDTVQQILHLGRLKQTLLDGQERRSFDEIVAEAIDAAGKLPPKPPSDLMEPGFGERLKSKVASFDAALLKVETFVDWLDGKNSEGVFNRIVFKPIADAQARGADMFAEYMAKLNEALAQVPKQTLSRWMDRITAPELLNRETGNPFTFTRQQLISMALNMGNEGNAQRLADGYGWNEAAILAALNRELSPDEWTYVQAVWDTLDGLWPHIEEMEKNINGVAPERVPARPLETASGTLRGGYFPAVYDSTRDYQSEKNAARETDLFETLYTRATTRASATKERAEQVKRPILLNLGVITRHIGEVTHDIAFREAVMNADKFLSSKRVMRAIDTSLGPEVRKQFRPWLKFVANQWAMERSGNEGIGAFMNKLRTNATVVGMGWRFSTMTMQLAGYSNSFEVVGAKWVSAAVAQASTRPVETFNFVMGKSGEIRHRMDTLDRDIDQGIRRMAGKANPLSEVRRFAYHGIGYMDRMVVIPTWIGAYNRALSEGAEEEAAIYAADKAVRQSQGAGAAKDMAAVARGTGQWGQALKLMTMFYSYLSAVYQRQRTLGRDVRSASAKDIPGLIARAWWLVVVPPVLSELMGGRGPGSGGDEDEEWGWWGAKQMLFQALGAIPLVRDLARPVWDGIAGDRLFDYQLSPVQRAGQSVVNVATDVGHAAQGEDTRHATRDTLEAAGYWTGLVPGQLAAATQFLVDVGRGDQSPQSVSDWYKGLTTGRVPEN